MREFISIAAILVAFVYFLTFGAAMMVALESQMHWFLGMLALSGLIVLRIWPALPVLAYLGAHSIWSWPWWVAGLLAFPVCIYVVMHYWVRLTDYFHRPPPEHRKHQGA